MNRRRNLSVFSAQCTVFWLIALLIAPLTNAGMLYWADNDRASISRSELDGSNELILTSTERALVGFAADFSMGKMYWTDNGSAADPSSLGRVYRANLDGSNQETLWVASSKDVESAGQIALNTNSGHLYVSDQRARRIFRMNLDGTNVETIFSAMDSPLGTALEIDPENGFLYFTTGTFAAGNSMVERIDLDGTNRTPIVNLYAYSLAIDIENNELYTADYHQNRIMQVHLDGTGTRQVASPIAPRDVQVFDNRLFFVDYDFRDESYFFQMVSSNLDGTSQQILFERPRLEGPLDLIQFAVIPEVSSLVLLAVAGTMGIIFRCRNACYGSCASLIRSIK